MSRTSSTSLIALVAIVGCGLAPREAQAGPLIDWLFGRQRAAPAYAVGPPLPVGSANVAGYAAYPPTAAVNPAGGNGFAGNYGTYYGAQLPVIGPAGAGYLPPVNSGITAATAPQTMQPSTLSYVPNYQTYAYRAPVTYYRPLLTTDPNTGAQVVAMAPCTSYEYMAQRTPSVGRRALFGSTSPPAFQPPPQALPTYTLPSGGVPLAFSSPGVTSTYGYRGNYGAYSAQQPLGALPSMPTTVGPTGAYPTTPAGSTPYYGNTNGGSCGGYAAPALQSVPGLVAPQSPSSIAPSYPQPGFSAPGAAQPGTVQPGAGPPNTVQPPSTTPGGVYPSPDPADTPPSLPNFPTSSSSSSQSSSQSNLRPQLRSIVRHPRAGEQPSGSRPGTGLREQSQEESRQPPPTMQPIPTPEDFEPQPRWNPGLLREEDMTAGRAATPSQADYAAQADYAGQSKQIHWASFESTRNVAKQPTGDGLRPIATAAPPAARAGAGAASPVLPPRRTGGWQASR